MWIRGPLESSSYFLAGAVLGTVTKTIPPLDRTDLAGMGFRPATGTLDMLPLVFRSRASVALRPRLVVGFVITAMVRAVACVAYASVCVAPFDVAVLTGLPREERLETCGHRLVATDQFR